jgi:hypothetical protein
MVVDCRKVKLKICFGSSLQPTIEHAFPRFSGACVFSVLDLNSAYFQNPFIPGGWRLLHPLWSYQFNKLPMGISMGCKGLSRVADLKENRVFNFMGNLVVHSVSIRALPAAPGSAREATVGGIHVEQGQGSPGSQRD